MMPNARRCADAVRRLDDDEVHSHREGRQGRTVRQSGQKEQAPNRRTHMRTLAMVERLLGEPERARPAPANLHDHELGGRPPIDRDQVQLGVSHADVPGEDEPARLAQPVGDQLLGRVAGTLLGRPRW